MYKSDKIRQLTLTDFNQPLGLKMDPNNRWVKYAAKIPWDAIEEEYAKLFPSKTGMPAKPLRVALGSLLIQKTLKVSDEELVEQIIENPYLQYFIGLPGYTNKAPFVPSLLVEFRKRLNEDVLCEINEMIAEYSIQKDNDSDDDSSGNGGSGTSENSGTLILDATCAPQNIEFPQDVNLLNASRESLEHIIDDICYTYNLYKPRMYRQNARRDFLLFARSKKHTKKKIRKAIRQQLQYIKRDIAYIEAFLASEYNVELTEKQRFRFETVRKIYDQQLYMYTNNVHTVPDRIVSLSQPFIRPIVRGKAAAPTEFGAKLDISIDEYGFVRVEKISFDAYNEKEVLKGAVQRYFERNGRYPERVLADKIYRNRENLEFCAKHGIRLSGPPLGRPKKNADIDKRIEYIDNADRVEVERAISLSKRCYGLGRIMTKLEGTTKSSIVLSIIAKNVAYLAAASLRQFLNSLILQLNEFKKWFEIKNETAQRSGTFLLCSC